ncbi:MAG: hypothetical protein KDB07_03275, partial [Planctomycetes bacterium]|nr:hypothetical protein [Planctomycetota bacterium]
LVRVLEKESKLQNLFVIEASLSLLASSTDAAHSESNRNKAFELLNRALDEGWKDRAHLEQDADLAPLRSDPRWQDLLKRLSE